MPALASSTHRCSTYSVASTRPWDRRDGKALLLLLLLLLLLAAAARVGALL